MTVPISLLAICLGLAPAIAATPIYVSAQDPTGDAVVSGADKDDLPEGVYDGADMDYAVVDNEDNDNADVLFLFSMRAIQGDASIGSTTLTVENTVKFLKKPKTKKNKARYGTRSVDIVYVIASPTGDEGVLVNGEPCFGTAASVTSGSYDDFTIRVPRPCFGAKPIAAQAVFRTHGSDNETGAVVNDTARPAVYSLRPQ